MDWKTIAMSRSSGGTSFIGRSPKKSWPLVGRSNPASMLRVVVLPQPDGPSSTRSSPSRISRYRCFTATLPPSNCLLTSTKRICLFVALSADRAAGGAMRFVALISLTLPLLQRIDQIEIANPALEEVGEERRRNDGDDRDRGHLGRLRDLEEEGGNRR